MCRQGGLATVAPEASVWHHPPTYHLYVQRFFHLSLPLSLSFLAAFLSLLALPLRQLTACHDLLPGTMPRLRHLLLAYTRVFGRIFLVVLAALQDCHRCGQCCRSCQCRVHRICGHFTASLFAEMVLVLVSGCLDGCWNGVG